MSQIGDLKINIIDPVADYAELMAKIFDFRPHQTKHSRRLDYH
jgi:phosphoglucomutase